MLISPLQKVKVLAQKVNWGGGGEKAYCTNTFFSLEMLSQTHLRAQFFFSEL